MRTNVAMTVSALTLVLISVDVYAKPSLSQVIDNVFSRMDASERNLLKNQLKSAPDEVTNSVVKNYSLYRTEDYYKVGADGKTAVTFAPSRGLNLNQGTLTGVYVRDGYTETHQYSVASRRRPDEVEVLDEHDAFHSMKRDGNFGFAMSSKKDKLNQRFEDVVSSMPIARRYTVEGNNLTIRDNYAVMEIAGEPRRFTLYTELHTQPPGVRVQRVKGANGKETYLFPPESLSISAIVSRQTPKSPITKIEGTFKPRGASQYHDFTFDLPGGNEGRQIQDIKFSDNPRAHEQTMEIVTTDAERLLYVIKMEGNAVKLVPTTPKHGTPKIDMKDYRATVKRIEGRRLVNAESGQGAKGIEIESGAGTGTGK